MNLLGNAIKFTEKGGVTLSARVHESHLAPGELTGGSGFSREAKAIAGAAASASSADNQEIILEFLIEDTGMGIPAEDQKRIFEPFTQADASTSRIYGGTGLGLTIAASRWR